MRYNFRETEEKWQSFWQENETFKAEDDLTKPKFYGLVEFPYPSGQGLHVGHPRGYTAIDIISRKKRMEGYNVLFPMGWDAFGLPTENYAIANKIHPAIVTEKNIGVFKRQLKMLGFSFDWSKEINTTDPRYFKWTQWIFLKLFEKGLAYKTTMPINFCTGCKVGLANEEVVSGLCERCGSEVVQREKSQWMLKITEYAERLIDDLDPLDYIEKVKIQQKNWIGRSEGLLVDFKIKDTDDSITVFTTRPDTLFGATYMVLSPEHKFVEDYKNMIKNYAKVKEYKTLTAKKTEFERTELSKEKTGVALEGVYAINPVNGKEIPVWISDYVLVTYGTGAIMAVPAHDERDWEFATKFNLPIIEVVASDIDVTKQPNCSVDDGVMVNSGFITGMQVKQAIEAMIEDLEQKNIGKRKTNYKLRDWVFSRQRYWGEPIPIVHCEKCGYVALSEDELPLLLPDTDNFEPGDDGESPLAKQIDWVNTTCPKCKGAAQRETDTMPQWAGSSWYFLRYIDPNNDSCIADTEKLKYWLPVDWYNGGMEHTTLHMLYSRFWHKFLFDIGTVPTKEPYQKRTSHGMILGENGEKMSKSRNNVINPDDVVHEFGADTFRTYEMFIGAFDQATPWSMQGVKGCYNFLERVWRLGNILSQDYEYSSALESTVHKTIKKVTEDIDRMKFNTAIATLMSFINEVMRIGSITKRELKTFLILLNPFAPHITEELWQSSGFDGYLHQSEWPVYDAAKTLDDEIEIAIQVNGKVRDKIIINADADNDSIKEQALACQKVNEFIGDKQIVKVVVIPKRLVNIVAK
ncbi:MAG: leucine--tRNA ligase [Clostridiaceae bacterium]|nr:leucine--tRNA ligase [Clostridiaceae bacterium]